MSTLPIGATTVGHLYAATLEEALDEIATTGYRIIEMAPAPPHWYTPGTGPFERRQLKRRLDALGLQVASVNPIELNLISQNHEFVELSVRHLLLNMELAHDLESPLMLFGPGRRMPLIPCPLEDARAALHHQVGRLLPRAEELGIRLAIENLPFGFLQTGEEVADFVREVGSATLGVAYDCGNAIAFEQASDGIDACADVLLIAHVNGGWRDRWAHTGVREGDVDFVGYADALRRAGFTSPTIYELLDGQPPLPRLRDDLPLLQEWGWTTQAAEGVAVRP